MLWKKKKNSGLCNFFRVPKFWLLPALWACNMKKTSCKDWVSSFTMFTKFQPEFEIELTKLMLRNGFAQNLPLRQDAKMEISLFWTKYLINLYKNICRHVKFIMTHILQSTNIKMLHETTITDVNVQKKMTRKLTLFYDQKFSNSEFYLIIAQTIDIPLHAGRKENGACLWGSIQHAQNDKISSSQQSVWNVIH